MDVRQGKALFVQRPAATPQPGIAFQIEDQRIRVYLDSPPIIDNEDEVIVAGKMDTTGVLHVYAYKNITKIVEGDIGYGAKFLLSFLSLLPILFFEDLTIAFLGISAYFFFQGIYVVNAVGQVRMPYQNAVPGQANASPAA
jgi:hypothetical protein